MRLILAALFAVMSLVHGPLMSFARASMAPLHHQGDVTTPHGAHHHPSHTGSMHEQAADRDTGVPDPGAATMPAPCYAIGCFTALTPTVTGPLPTAAILLGQLLPTLGRNMIPEEPDPAVPPPRLQV
ncbi:MAG: hypothetical protein ACRECO_03975 [Xanthobacteraceae bacterium]